MHTRQQEWCRAQPTRSGPGRSAGGHGWARLCQFPGAAQTVSASLGHSGACTVPLGWCWGSTCGTWAPSPGSEEPWGPPGWCGRWDWPGPQGGCSSLRSLRSHRAIVGDASDERGSGPRFYPGKSRAVQTWEATWGLGHRSGSLAARECWLRKVLVTSPGQGLPEDLFNKYF